MLVQVKQNQSALLNDIDAQFQAYWALPQEKQAFYATHNKGHGRTEVREVYTLPANFSVELRDKWSMVKSIVAVVRDRTVGDKESYETSYYRYVQITSARDSRASFEKTLAYREPTTLGVGCHF